MTSSELPSQEQRSEFFAEVPLLQQEYSEIYGDRDVLIKVGALDFSITATNLQKSSIVETKYKKIGDEFCLATIREGEFSVFEDGIWVFQGNY